ncbi:MAG TPA: hypothetical protein VKH19_08635 [Gemmatimonadaceae bacterium]|nr:hypothetical protein [Gemmatimonadaceae bacterium]
MPAVWIPLNFSSTTGYAWKVIHGVQSVIARRMRERGVRYIASHSHISVTSPDLQYLRDLAHPK